MKCRFLAVVALVSFELSVQVVANDAMKVIADKKQSIASIDKALNALDAPPKEQPGFWIKLADDRSFSDAHRRKSLLQLFVRHAKGKTLREVAAWGRSHQWFAQDKIVVHQGPYFGPSPFGRGTTPGFFCKLFPDLPDGNQSVIFLKLPVNVSGDDLRKVFRSEQSDIENLQIAAVSAIELREDGQAIRWFGK